jgi:O-antigen biosynthesis protein
MKSQEMLENIQNLIQNCQWREAQKLIDEYRKTAFNHSYTDMVEIFQAAIYMNDKEYDKAEKSILDGLRANITNYELYFMLGNLKEIYENKAQALFAYENAVFYCHNEDKEFLEEHLINYKQENSQELPGKVALLLTACHNFDYLKLCIDSIRSSNLEDSYEIILTNYAALPGERDWLKAQRDIIYLENVNPKKQFTLYSDGINAALESSDIFLLHTESVIMPNTIFNMRMCLYEDHKTGAAGSVTNLFDAQRADEVFQNMEQYVNYSSKNNIYDSKRHELCSRLLNFSILYKRTILNKIGCFDESFEDTQYVIDDMNLRLIQEGYRLQLCHDSFIYCFGLTKMDDNKTAEAAKPVLSDADRFFEKWGIDIKACSKIREDFIDIINKGEKEAFQILEIGCGMGATLLKIKDKYRASNVFGIELKKEEAMLGASLLNIESMDIEDMNLNYSKNFFDYILLGDLLEHFHKPEKILVYLRGFLKKNGIILAGIHNLQNQSVLLPLLKGDFTYKDNGILDRRHIKFFTKNEIIKLFKSCDYTMLDLYAKTEQLDKNTEELLNKLCSIDNSIDAESIRVVQYLVEAAKH